VPGCGLYSSNDYRAWLSREGGYGHRTTKAKFSEIGNQRNVYDIEIAAYQKKQRICGTVKQWAAEFSEVLELVLQVQPKTFKASS